jgi:3-deoxy-manno-octulosonate cytidylyltransferase (CMP-KDO synthetase)
MGKPLIEHVYLRASSARTVDRVIVATDDRRIMDAVSDFGGDCVMTSGDHRSGSDRLGEAVQTLEADIVVNVQGDEPLLDPGAVDALIRVFEGSEAPDIATIAVPLTSLEDFKNRHVVKVVTDSHQNAMYFSRSPIPHGWEPGLGEALRHIGIYAYRRQALMDFTRLPSSRLEKAEDLEQLRALENGMDILVVRLKEHRGTGVDRPEDIARVEDIMREQTGTTTDPASGRSGRGS